MVVLYGIPGDGPFEIIADALEELHQPFVIINPRQFAEFDFLLHYDKGKMDGEITIGSASYPLSGITGIYNRVAAFATVPEAQALSPETFHKYNQVFDLFNNWIECCEIPVLNKASAMSSNNSKPYQLTLITPYFKVPDTVITNSTTSVEEFRMKSGHIIYKSASSVRSIVKEVTDESLQDLQKIRYCPTLFQNKLEGINYRVHIVGEEVFAIKVASQEIDYRYNTLNGDTELIPFKLESDIEQKCIALSKSLRLPLAGIDLFQTEKGEWFCFEVNPSPGFSYFEKKTSQPISKAVAKYLSGEAS